MPKEGKDRNDLWVEMPPSGKSRTVKPAEPPASKEVPKTQTSEKSGKASAKSSGKKSAAAEKKEKKDKRAAKTERAAKKDKAAKPGSDFDFNIAKPMDIQKKALKNKKRDKTDTDGKKPARRKKLSSYLFYYIIFAVVAVTVICVLSTTVLFNITEINVSGETEYSAQDVIQLSGVENGRNLITLDTGAIEQKLIKELPYVDGVKVKKHLPSSLEIELTPAVPVANVKKNDVYYLVSANGRIMETDLASPNKKYVTVVGFDPEYASAGDYLSVTDEGSRNLLAKLLKCVKQYSGTNDSEENTAVKKYDIMFSLLKDCDEVGITEHIKEIDISNIYKIKLNYDDRLTLELGEYTEPQFKLTIAKNMIDRGEFDGEKGTLLLSQLISSSDEIKFTFRPGSQQSGDTSSGGDNSGDDDGNNGDDGGEPVVGDSVGSV